MKAYQRIIIITFVLVILSFCNNLYAITWTKTFGGTSNDEGRSVQQTTDGGYIITGTTLSYGAGSSDVWLIKTNASGVKQWDQTFGGTNEDFGRSVQQTIDGGYIITGHTYSYGVGSSDVWLIKTNASGVKQWDQTFGGNLYDGGESVKQTTDGGYILTGMLTSTSNHGDVWLIKTDTSGVVQWDKTWGSSNDDYGKSVQLTTNGGYILTGSLRYSSNNNDVWLIGTDADGNILVGMSFGGNFDDWGESVQQTTDGGYIITGTTLSYGAGSYDVWLIKTDTAGVKQWDKTFGGAAPDYGHSVQQTTDGGYIITGSYGANVCLIKTDASGIKQWDKTFDGEVGYSVQQTTDGGYIITGSYETDVLLIKTNENGNFVDITEETLSLSLPGGGICPPTEDYLHASQDGCNGSIVWLSSNTSIAQVDYNTGYVEAINYGNTTITAYCSTEMTCLDTCPVTVIECPGSCQVNIIEDNLDLSYPGGEGCDPTEYDLNFTYENCSGTIQWESSDTEVATVDNNGLVTAVGLGSCIITAYCSTQTDCKDECPVTVVPCSSSEHHEGGTGDDEGYCVTQTSDGGCIISGYTESEGAGGADIWLVKFNEWGTLQWDKYFGGLYDDAGWFVIQSGDGGYVLCGDETVDPLGEIIQCVGLKMDYNGNKEWEFNYGSTGNWNGGRCVRPIYNTKGDKSSEIGYIFAGYNKPNGSDYDVLLIKTNATLLPQWNKTIGGTNDDFGNSVVVANDGSFVIAGWTGTYGSTNCDILVIKTDSDGNVLPTWPKTYNIQDGDEGNYIMQTSDNGYIIAGTCGLNGSNDSDLFLMKIDSSGSVEWTKTYGDANDDQGYAVVQTPDGGFYISGYYVPPVAKGSKASKNLYLVKTDENGNQLWTWTKGGTLDDASHHLNMSACQSGIILTGYTQSFSAGGDKDLWLVSYSSIPAVPFSTKNIMIITAIIISGLLLFFIVFRKRNEVTK